MEPISITLSAAGRPFLTTRVNSVTFDQSGRPERSDRATTSGTTTSGTTALGTGVLGEARPQRGEQQSQASGPLPTEKGAGFGAEAQRGAFQANAAEAANLGRAPETETSGTKSGESESPDGLSDAEREQVEKLRARDAEVRRHEQAHAAVGGQYASAPTYTFQLGPDGRRYAIGGEVQIDVAPVAGDPEATIDKMGVVKAAALAPAEPSSADRRVAALADSQRLQAVSELATLKTEERLEVFAETAIQGESSTQDGDAGPKAKPDSRFADAAGILAQGEETMPGQKLDTAA